MEEVHKKTFHKVFEKKEPPDWRPGMQASGLLSLGTKWTEIFYLKGLLSYRSKRTSIKCLYYDGTGFVILMKRLEKGLFSRINPLFKGDVTLTAAEFALFFEGADLEKRFIESPSEVKKTAFPMRQELQEASI